VGALNGIAKEEFLSDHYGPVKGYWTKHPLGEEIAVIATGSFKHKNPPRILGSGYVVKSLEAALWAFYWYGADPREWKQKLPIGNSSSQNN
jgi:hypothetical protein